MNRNVFQRLRVSDVRFSSGPDGRQRMKEGGHVPIPGKLSGHCKPNSKGSIHHGQCFVLTCDCKCHRKG